MALWHLGEVFVVHLCSFSLCRPQAQNWGNKTTSRCLMAGYWGRRWKKIATFTSVGSGVFKGEELLSFELRKVTLGAFVQGETPFLDTKIPHSVKWAVVVDLVLGMCSLCMCGRKLAVLSSDDWGTAHCLLLLSKHKEGTEWRKVQKVKEKVFSCSLLQVSWDLTVSTLIVYLILFGQAVLNVLYVGICI